MNATSAVSVLGAFVVVLGVMAIALRLLRKYTMGNAGSRDGRQMEVLQRLALGQRQGIAVVRIDQRRFAVSMGDGGVRLLAELSENTNVPSTILSSGSNETSSIHSGDILALKSIARVRDRIKAKSTVALQRKVAHDRVSYVAPIEDFKAVLSIAMNGAARS